MMSRAIAQETSAPPKAVRVMIVDDHPVIREGLRAIVEAQADMIVVGEAGDGAEALQAHDRFRPDVCIIDLRMPSLTGAEMIRAARRGTTTTRFVILSSYSTAEDIREAIDAGAQGYLLKSTSAREMIAAVRAVHGGRRYFAPEVSDVLMQRDSHDALTWRETQVLELAASGHRNRAIAQRLAISVHTVKGHIKNILSKLGAQDRTEAVSLAIRRGIVRLD